MLTSGSVAFLYLKVTPLDSSAADCGSGKTVVPASVKMGLEVAESLPAGSGEDLLWGGQCENSDVEMGPLSQRRPVDGLRLWGHDR